MAVLRDQRLRLVLGILQLAIAGVVLVVMLIGGLRWYGWLIMASALLSGLTQLYAYRQAAREPRLVDR